MKWWRRQHGGRRYTNNDNCSGGRRPSKFNKNILFTQKKNHAGVRPRNTCTSTASSFDFITLPCSFSLPPNRKEEGKLKGRNMQTKQERKGKKKKKVNHYTKKKHALKFSIFNLEFFTLSLPMLLNCISFPTTTYDLQLEKFGLQIKIMIMNMITTTVRTIIIVSLRFFRHILRLSCVERR